MICICYVDDDQDEHFIFESALQEAFPEIKLFSFFTCDDLLAFLKVENSPLPELVFMDYNMPGASGTKCVTTIKNVGKLAHLPVVIYSTSIDLAMRDETYNGNAFKFIEKQSSIFKLKEILAELFSEVFESRSIRS